MARYIDADALKDWSEIVPLTGDGGIDINDFDEKLASMPAADVAPARHGEWIEVDDAYNRISGKCSVCGWEAHLYEDDVVGMPYCPNCGAKNGGEV